MGRKRKRGIYTVEAVIDIDDVVDFINFGAGTDDLDDILEAVNEELKTNPDKTSMFPSETLDDIEKVKLLRLAFDKFTVYQLEEMFDIKYY